MRAYKTRMNLDEYLRKAGSQKLRTIAKEAGLSESLLSNKRAKTNWTPESALKIQRATGGEVLATDISDLAAAIVANHPLCNLPRKDKIDDKKSNKMDRRQKKARAVKS